MPLEYAHTRGRFGYSASMQQQSTEGGPTPIIRRGAETESKKQCTLSHIRSGHCHLRQDYKNMVFGVHLFACNAHPTDLSTEDLWQNPVDQVVRLATSATGILTDLTTNLIVANNNHNITLDANIYFIISKNTYEWRLIHLN